MPEEVLDFCATNGSMVFKGSKLLMETLMCGVCNDLMLNPFTLSCGHSFCGGCLSHWLKSPSRRKTCPACRAAIQHTPAPAIALRELALQAVTVYKRVVGDASGSLVVQNPQPSAKQLFEGLDFDVPIYDEEDELYRCPRCNFELEDGYCQRCDREYAGADDDEDFIGVSDEDDDDEDEDDVMDSEDRQFIVDDDDDDALQEHNASSASSAEESPRRDSNRRATTTIDDSDTASNSDSDDFGFDHSRQGRSAGRSQEPSSEANQDGIEITMVRHRGIMVNDSDSEGT